VKDQMLWGTVLSDDAKPDMVTGAVVDALYNLYVVARDDGSLMPSSIPSEAFHTMH
jgi:hypothetical protein